MSAHAIYQTPPPRNEPILEYRPGSPERAALREALNQMRHEDLEIPMYIGGERVTSGVLKDVRAPHEHALRLGRFHASDEGHVTQAIDAALAARPYWETMSFEHRAAVFLKAADLLAGPYRAQINAATMLGQSKSVYQAEIDAACEMIDFLRFNVHFARQIYLEQPISPPGFWNRMDYRALEGFVFALTPFNFTAIAGNLPTSPALMGNVVVWKPANTQILAAQLLMRVFLEAGLPAGVINLIYPDGPTAGRVVTAHPDFVGLHFTGSTGTFDSLYQQIANNLSTYRTYPRIVGETGGKDFVIAHPTATAPVLATALIRGAFEYQGQKCSAASRAYIPRTLWEQTWPLMQEQLSQITMGSVEDFSHFFNAVIDERSFDRIVWYLDKIRANPATEIIAGGKADKSVGYFIEPTVVLTKDPMSVTMCEEIFGPVLTVYVYEDDNYEEALSLLDQTSPYALTGAIFAQDRAAIEMANDRLRHACGNFYINDKPTGAVVGQQPFGGARKSGTNDKAGSHLNLLRWVSARATKETLVPPTDFRYPFMLPEKDA